MPAAEGILGFSVPPPLLALLLVALLGALAAAQRRWRPTESRRDEAERPAGRAAREEAVAEMEYTFGPGYPRDHASVSLADAAAGGRYCAVCFNPTSLRCAKCKAVKYCSGKCQIIHWRKGHKDVCHSLTVDAAKDDRDIPEFKEQSDLCPNDSDIEGKIDERFIKQPKGSPPDTTVSSRGIIESESIDFIDTSRMGGSLQPSTSPSSSDSSVISGAKRISDHENTTGIQSSFIDDSRASASLSSESKDTSNLFLKEFVVTPPENATNTDNSKNAVDSKVNTQDSEVSEEDDFVKLDAKQPKPSSEQHYLSGQSMSSQMGSKFDASERKNQPEEPTTSYPSKDSLSTGSHQDPHHTAVNFDNALDSSISSRDFHTKEESRLKKSILRVTQQLRHSNHLRNYSSEIANDMYRKHKMIFSYDFFVKLYNYDELELRPFGLQNCGNSCYANAILQCLAFTRPLSAYIIQGFHAKTCPRRSWCFTCELEHLLMKAKEGKSVLSPINILSHIDKVGSHLGHGREEDAHEFLRYAVDALHSVCLKEAGANKAGSLAEETTLIQLIFGGYLRSKVKCLKCRGKSIQNERILDLSVEIHGDIETLEEALRRFTMYEFLDGENKYKCDRCKSYERAKKKLTVLEAPNVLTIALKRFQSGKFGKLNKAVRFSEHLNLAPYMSGTDDKFPVYQLYAVVVHRDIMNASFSGHYVCYVRCMKGKWYEVDDSRVEPVELERVLNRTAYLLFYARCSPRGPSLLRKALSIDMRKSNCTVEESHASSRSLTPLNLRPGYAVPCHNTRPSGLFDARFPKTDAASDSSSLFSCSDESTFSTESNRDSTSTELSDYLFGDSGHLRFSEDTDSFTFSPLASSCCSSEAVLNEQSGDLNLEPFNLLADGAVKQHLGRKKMAFQEENAAPPILYSDKTNTHCRESLTEQNSSSSREAELDNSSSMSPSILRTNR